MKTQEVVESLERLLDHAQKALALGDYGPGAAMYWRGRITGLSEAIETIRECQMETPI